MQSTFHYVDNHAGWKLALKQVIDPQRHDRTRRPVVIVPGYGMNAFIFGYHPGGQSLEEHLASAGFEVWSINLRNQEPSLCCGGSSCYGMADIIRNDLPAAVEFIRENQTGQRQKVDLVGCSLGGAYVYGYLALHGDAKVGAVVGMGAPLRWVEAHPALKAAMSSPRLLGMLPFRHTRTLARIGLPLLAKVPGLLHIYLHPDIVDLSHPEELIRTVEDPNPQLNEEIARWVNDKDLIVDGVSVAEELHKVSCPVLCMISNADGIVPPATALSVLDVVGSAVKDSYTAGTDSVRMAHADLYISRYSQELVFQPLTRWLIAQN